jgi:hypothetical protein
VQGPMQSASDLVTVAIRQLLVENEDQDSLHDDGSLGLLLTDESRRDQKVLDFKPLISLELQNSTEIVSFSSRNGFTSSRCWGGIVI